LAISFVIPFTGHTLELNPSCGNPKKTEPKLQIGCLALSKTGLKGCCSWWLWCSSLDLLRN